ncbi:invasin domain 3-containing protein [Enterobacter asburiae]
MSFPVTGVTGVKIAGLVEAPEASGHYSAQVSGTQAGVAAISVTYGGTTISGLSASLTLIPANTPSVTTSQLTVDRTSIPADGKTPSTLKLTLRNANGIPVIDAQGVEFISSLTTGVNISPVVNHGDGTYTAELTGTTAGMTAVISARVGGMVLGTISQSVALTDGDADVSQSQFTVDKTIITADGVDKSTLKLTLRNAGGVPVTNQQGVAFHSSRATGVTVSPVTINGDGTYTAVLSGTAAGSAVVTITIDGQVFAVASQTVNLTANAATAKVADLTVTHDGAVADGSATNSVTVKVQDANGNAVKANVTLTASNGAVIAPTVEVDGSKEVTLTSTTAGTSTVKATIGSASLSKDVSFTAAPADVKLILSGSSAPADGTSKITITAVVTRNGALVGSGVRVKFVPQENGLDHSDIDVDTNNDSKATFWVSSTRPVSNLAVNVSANNGPESIAHINFYAPVPEIVITPSLSGTNFGHGTAGDLYATPNPVPSESTLPVPNYSVDTNSCDGTTTVIFDSVVWKNGSWGSSFSILSNSSLGCKIYMWWTYNGQPSSKVQLTKNS